MYRVWTGGEIKVLVSNTCCRYIASSLEMAQVIAVTVTSCIRVYVSEYMYTLNWCIGVYVNIGLIHMYKCTHWTETQTWDNNSRHMLVQPRAFTRSRYASMHTGSPASAVALRLMAHRAGSRVMLDCTWATRLIAHGLWHFSTNPAVSPVSARLKCRTVECLRTVFSPLVGEKKNNEHCEPVRTREGRENTRETVQGLDENTVETSNKFCELDSQLLPLLRAAELSERNKWGHWGDRRSLPNNSPPRDSPCTMTAGCGFNS